MKQLIVNADDFGYTRGVNRGIVDGYRRGMITSTSLLVNGAAFEDAVEQATAEPGLNVGCHLNLVEGAPISEPRTIPHLVGTDGKFRGLTGLAMRLMSGLVPAVELERECSAQIEKLLEAGIRPTHLDTHQHTHLHPRVSAAVAKVAQKFSIGWVRRPFENCWPRNISGLRPRRAISFSVGWLAPRFERLMLAQGLRMTDSFTGFELTGRWTKQAIEDTLSMLPPGVTELMSHPGYYDRELETMPTQLKREREAELDILMDGQLRNELTGFGITLTGFSGIGTAVEHRAAEPVLARGLAGGELR